MSTIPEPPPIPRPKTPVLVWIISIYFLFGVFGTIVSLVIMNSGFLPLPPAQKQYFESLTWFDHTMSVVISGINAVGAILFIQLRRSAYYLFLTAFIVSLVFIGYQIVAKNWLNAIGAPGIPGIVVGWMLILAILFYARHLVKTRVLR